MILHLLWSLDSIYSKNYLQFIEGHYDSSNHRFVVLNRPEKEEVFDVEYIDCNSLKKCGEVARLINKSERTILHGIFMRAPLALTLSLLARGDKMSWMIWGADLYSWRNLNSGIKAKISNVIQRRIRKKCKSIIISFASDRDEYIKQFGTPLKCFSAHYVLPFSKKEIEQNYVEKENKSINILIGNSANKELKHLEVLELLKKMQREKIKIHIPLNYGNTVYGDEVEKNAQYMFGDDVNCYRKNIPIDQYIKLLWQIDIAVFYTDRQIALGNIIMLLYMGKEIFMKKGSPMYKCLREYGVDIKDLEDIESAVYNAPDKKQKRSDNQYVCERLDIDTIKRQWDLVFEN